MVTRRPPPPGRGTHGVFGTRGRAGEVGRGCLRHGERRGLAPGDGTRGAGRAGIHARSRTRSSDFREPRRLANVRARCSTPTDSAARRRLGSTATARPSLALGGCTPRSRCWAGCRLVNRLRGRHSDAVRVAETDRRRPKSTNNYSPVVIRCFGQVRFRTPATCG